MEQERGQRRTLYRIVRTNPPTLDDFTSGARQGRPIPAHLPGELHRLWDGLSAYATLVQARRKQRRSPNIGGYVAALELVATGSVRVERTTREPGHHTVWGPPDALLACVVEVVPADIRIEREEPR